MNKLGFRMKVLLPSGAAAAAMGLVLTASPAHAVTWESHTQTGASSTDPGGVYAISALQRADGETGGYWSEFNPDGTPDGSGDIPEGYRVSIRVCINDTTTCSAYAKGFA